MSAISTEVHNTAAGAVNGQAYQPMAGTAGTSTSATGNSPGVITSNDFLDLLVTEMKNQDPTATTDPNEYINQLVNVNSLEQLISINQELGMALTGGSGSSGTTGGTGSSGSTGSTGTGGSSGANPAIAVATLPAGHATQNPAVAVGNTTLSPSPLESVQGNLSIPARSPAAARIAHALDGLH